MRATGKYLQGLMGPASNQQQKTIYHLTHLAMYLCSFPQPEQYVCHVHLFTMRQMKTKIVSDFLAKTVDLRVLSVAYLIGQLLANILSQIPVPQANANKSYGCKCKRLQFIFCMVAIQIDFLTCSAVQCYNFKTTSLIQLKF